MHRRHTRAGYSGDMRCALLAVLALLAGAAAIQVDVRDSEVWLIRDGQATQLTHDGKAELQAELSPALDRIAYYEECPQAERCLPSVVVMDLAGRRLSVFQPKSEWGHGRHRRRVPYQSVPKRVCRDRYLDRRDPTRLGGLLVHTFSGWEARRWSRRPRSIRPRSSSTGARFLRAFTNSCRALRGRPIPSASPWWTARSTGQLPQKERCRPREVALTWTGSDQLRLQAGGVAKSIRVP